MVGAAERIQGCPRDLLRQFSGGLAPPEEPRGSASAGTEEDSCEIELSLGLSLGGCFGADPARRRGLHRSSSVAAIPLPQLTLEDPSALPLLKRTSSLPAEAEEEQRKRKELQCLRRMEVKRKRSEVTNGSWTWGLDPAASPEREGGRGPGGWLAPNGVSAAAASCDLGAAAPCFAAASQGSVGSQGSSSSGVSEFGSRPPKQEELWGNGADLRRSSSTTQLPLPDLTAHGTSVARTPVKREEVVEGPRRELATLGVGRGAMEDMPCVATRGDGPNGQRVEGLLYKYGKGEEVRIVCICHGRFLSPAEFVRHGGGGDVAHPLRHIVVKPSPPTLGFL